MLTHTATLKHRLMRAYAHASVRMQTTVVLTSELITVSIAQF
jgi:hypothetical protein